MDNVFTSTPVLIAVGTAAASAAYLYLNRSSKTHKVLSNEEFRKFPLIKKTVLSHNSALYRFELPTPTDVLGLPIGQHISILKEIDGKQILRSYTPTSSDTDKGWFELVVKTYDEGIISKHLDALAIGDTINVRGPKGAFKYTPNMIQSFGMIAGGTGITPMFQVAKAILTNPNDKTKVSLLYANVNEDDILLRKEIDAFAKQHPENFKVHYVLNNPPADWVGSSGFVTKELIKEYCPAPSDDIKILVCGPPPMVKAISLSCEELGYTKPRALSKMEDMVFKF